MGRLRKDGQADRRYGPRNPPGPIAVTLVLGLLGYAYCATRDSEKKTEAPTTGQTDPKPAPVEAGTSARKYRLVANTGGEGAFLRRAPGTEQDTRIRLIAEGTLVEVSGTTRSLGGSDWSEVRTGDGTAWIASKYLADAP